MSSTERPASPPTASDGLPLTESPPAAAPVGTDSATSGAEAPAQSQGPRAWPRRT